MYINILPFLLKLCTLSLFRYHAMLYKNNVAKLLDVILDKIKEAGFHVAARKETTLTKDIAEMLYKQNAS